MKQRLGFVSNSSSASYILTIHNISMEQLYKLIHDEGLPVIFNEARQDRERKDRIQAWWSERILNDMKTEQKAAPYIKLLREELESEHGTEFNQELVKDKAILTLMVGRIKAIRSGDNVILTGFTTMHNWYDDMPKLLMILAMAAMGELGLQVTLRTEHDG